MSSANIIPFGSPSSAYGIQLLAWRAGKPGGAVVFYVDAAVGPVTIYGIAVVRGKHGNDYWVALPSKRSERGRNFPVVSIEEPYRSELIKAVLELGKQRGAL